MGHSGVNEGMHHKPTAGLERVCDLHYTPHECLNLANQMRRKLGVFDRKLEGNHSTFHCYSDIY